MPRCKHKSPVEGFIDLALRLPQWLCLVLAALSYFTFHSFVISPPPTIQSTCDFGYALVPIMLRSVAMVAQYVMPILLTVGAILSGIRSFP